jgi:hypothetical protein
MKMTETILPIPDHWPPHYNANTSPCDIIQGPCACGAWHQLDDDWVLKNLQQYGVRLRVKTKKIKKGESYETKD